MGASPYRALFHYACPAIVSSTRSIMSDSIPQPPDSETSSETPVILVENVSKQFHLTEQTLSLRHETTQIVRRMLGRREAAQPQHDQFWALRDVTFSVRRGEAVAVVGRNGAGKSTLFRLMCGITRPTTGRIHVEGRFATLIALGAGFSPDRTGRENIFLNAAIQGVSPGRTRALLNDIIAFSELGEFIDMPVKRYSSGMTARLGFSVAIHIAPDIVFMDEVMAVGDVAFQEKCMERIQDMKADGRTLMVVSHSLGEVRSICERTIWLDRGRIMGDGPTDRVLDQYMQAIRSQVHNL